jgi:hypothetical protein
VAPEVGVAEGDEAMRVVALEVGGAMADVVREAGPEVVVKVHVGK